MLPTVELKSEADAYADAIASAVNCAADGDSVGAKNALLPIAAKVWPGMPAWEKPARNVDGVSLPPETGARTFSKQRQADTFVRDRFQCYYCGQRLFGVPMMAALSAVFPEELPYIHTYNTGQIHAAYWLNGAEADHLVPGSRGGDWLDIANHVAACVFCNSRKSDFTIEELNIQPHPNIDSSWSGQIEHYRAVWEFAGRPNPRYHSDWIATFERSANLAAVSPTNTFEVALVSEPKDESATVPKVHSTSSPSAWTLESILAAITRKSASMASAAKQLTDWVDSEDDLVGEVRETKKPGIYRLYGSGRRQSAIFSLKSSGTIEILFDSLKHHPPFNDANLREEFRTKLNEIEGVEIPTSRIDDWPTFSLAALRDPGSMAQFQDSVSWCLKRFPS